jgi:hypothetical protein
MGCKESGLTLPVPRMEKLTPFKSLWTELRSNKELTTTCCFKTYHWTKTMVAKQETQHRTLFFWHKDGTKYHAGEKLLTTGNYLRQTNSLTLWPLRPLWPVQPFVEPLWTLWPLWPPFTLGETSFRENNLLKDWKNCQRIVHCSLRTRWESTRTTNLGSWWTNNPLTYLPISEVLLHYWNYKRLN